MKKLEAIEQYQDIISNGKSILMFTADWCGDCRFIEPVMPEIEASFPEYTFYSVNRDEFIDLCGDLNIFGIPSFIAYENGSELGRFVSKDRKTKEEIENFINSL